MQGRKPKPTALKRLEGNPGKRALNINEPRFSALISKCPKHLDAIARKEWKRVVAELETLGLITEADMASLAGYCACYSRWVQAEESIQKFGSLFLKTPSGYAQPHPGISVANRALELMNKYASEFGLTPVARSRLSVTAPTTNPDPFADFMASIGAGDIETPTNDSIPEGNAVCT